MNTTSKMFSSNLVAALGGCLVIYAHTWKANGKVETEFLLKKLLFRKMLMITLYVRQQKRHRCIEQSFGLCGRRRGWDDLGEWHWNVYIIIWGTNRQSGFDAWDTVLRAGALGWPRRMAWGGRGVQDGGHMYTCGRFMSIYGKTSTML